MLTPPWPFANINTGFYADAGEDVTASVGESINLTGTVYQEGVPNTEWDVDWTVEEGTGTINISNNDSRTTTVRFNNAGTYYLRFTAYDTDDVDLDGEEAKLITISDYVRVTVN